MESKDIIDFLKTHRDTAVSGDTLRQYPASLVEYLKRERLIFDPTPGAPPFPLHRWCVSEKGRQAIEEYDRAFGAEARARRAEIRANLALAISFASLLVAIFK